MHTSILDPENKNAEYFCHGRVEALHHFALMCAEMERQLWDTGKKFRVTIECDPERKEFIMKREPMDQ